MNINATIIAQAFNVFVTFWIVRFLLINPVMRALASDQKVIDDLSSGITTAQHSIASLKKEQESEWGSARTDFYAQLPKAHTVSDSIFTDVAPSIDAIAFSQKDQRSFIDQSAEKIVTRLE